MNRKAIIQETAQRTLRIEVETLQGLQKALTQDFVNSVEAVFENPGRLVVSGVGKSALIGQKIVATLNSTGTPALFMHAADAIHGDLGMIQARDLALCISKSGETAEIKVLLPLLQSRGIRIIGMVSKPDSYLGRKADFLLHTPIPQEADPNNLAPTSSTTAQAAMGDALATSLLALRGFTAEDFARFHPGGALGKQLYLRVHDLLEQRDQPAVPLHADVRKIIVEISTKRLGAAAVLNDQQQVVGIITDGDLRRMLEKYTDLSTLTAEQLMSPQPKSIAADALAVEALEQMQAFQITQLIVLEKDRYKGMVHLHDLLREGLI